MSGSYSRKLRSRSKRHIFNNKDSKSVEQLTQGTVRVLSIEVVFL